jgi:hypothetical protein
MRDAFLRRVTDLFGLDLNPGAAFPTIPAKKWIPLADEFGEIVNQIALQAIAEEAQPHDAPNIVAV